MGQLGTWLDLGTVLAKYVRFRHELEVTGEDILNYSPTGEMYKLYELRLVAAQDAEFVATLTEAERGYLGIESASDNSSSQT